MPSTTCTESFATDTRASARAWLTLTAKSCSAISVRLTSTVSHVFLQSPLSQWGISAKPYPDTIFLSCGIGAHFGQLRQRGCSRCSWLPGLQWRFSTSGDWTWFRTIKERSNIKANSQYGLFNIRAAKWSFVTFTA